MVPRTAALPVLVIALGLAGCSLLNQGLPSSPGSSGPAAAVSSGAVSSGAASSGAASSGAPATSAAPVSASPAGPTTAPSSPATSSPPSTAGPAVVTVTVTPSTSPAARTQVLATDVLDTLGLGPLQLGLPLTTLRERGYVVAATDSCVAWEASPALRAMGVEVQLYQPGNHLGEIWLIKPTVKTRSGAAVGMTVARLKQIYGSKLVVETKNGNGGPFQALVIKDGLREVVFMIAWEAQPVSDGDAVTSITARTASKDMFGSC